MNESLFDGFGGYYSVMEGGVEFARFAPSNFWTEFWNNNARSDWSFRFVSKEKV